MESIEFQQPEFLLCEKSIEDYEHDGKIEFDRPNSAEGGYWILNERTWVYHLKSESLMEFYCTIEDQKPPNIIAKHKDFVFNEEYFRGYFVQNNTKRLGLDEDTVLDSAWAFLEGKFKWEHKFYNLDDKEPIE